MLKYLFIFSMLLILCTYVFDCSGNLSFCNFTWTPDDVSVAVIFSKWNKDVSLCIKVKDAGQTIRGKEL